LRSSTVRDKSKRSMTVSFVIPTRNQAAFIRRCLDSCLAQRVDGEICVRDGLSTDRTREILAEYGDQIRWVSEKDDGQSDAVNRGVQAATGELIAWINSDDYYTGPDVLARVLGHFAADPELDIVYGDGMMVDGNGHPIRRYPSRPLPSAASIVIHPSSPLLQPATFFRRSLFVDVGGLDQSLHFTMDYDLWIRMWSRARRTRHVPELWANATYHDDAKSVRNMNLQIRETITVKRRYAPKLRLGLGGWWRLSVGVASLYAYLAATRSGFIRTT
jgi:glycosyltransferase involved in cell wall biosynthesis